MCLNDAFDGFILSRRLADLSDKTIHNYASFIFPFVLHCGVDMELSGLTQKHINSYISFVLDKPIAKATRATYIRHLKIFLKWAAEHNDVLYNYKEIRVPKSPKKNVKIYTPEEVKLIFDSILTESEWLTLRNKSIIAVMYDSGLRQSEVCTLQLARVSFQDNSMVVCGKGAKERTVPLGKFTAYYLQQYLSKCPFESDSVFVSRRGEPLTNNAVKLLVNKLSRLLPFELSSHKLRHNFATNYCIDQYEHYGHMDVYQLMIIMGHEDIETTQMYLHHANEIIAIRNHISHLDMIRSKKDE